MFLGYWYGTNGTSKYWLNINMDSHAVYKIEWPDSNSVSIEGTARANATRLNIGSRPYFDVSQYPRIIDTTTERTYIPAPDGTLFLATFKMTLNGLHKAKEDIPTGDFVFYK